MIKITGIDYSSLKLDPIPDLIVGDKLVRTVAGSTSIPKVGDCIAVHSLSFPPGPDEDCTIRRWDFSYLYRDSDGNVQELRGDSRYFERLEDRSVYDPTNDPLPE